MFRDGYDNPMTWTCHICKEERPDEKISVRRKPLLNDKGIPSRVISQNVRYCNDNVECAKASHTFSFLRNWS